MCKAVCSAALGEGETAVPTRCCYIQFTSFSWLMFLKWKNCLFHVAFNVNLMLNWRKKVPTKSVRLFLLTSGPPIWWNYYNHKQHCKKRSSSTLRFRILFVVTHCQSCFSHNICKRKVLGRGRLNYNVFMFHHTHIQHKFKFIFKSNLRSDLRMKSSQSIPVDNQFCFIFSSVWSFLSVLYSITDAFQC